VSGDAVVVVRPSDVAVLRAPRRAVP
jgi:hypothetical protein